MEGFSAYFVQKHGDISASDNREALVESFGYDSTHLAYPVQIHSNKVKVVEEPGIIQNIDGVISDKKDIVLSIQVADCIPLFLADGQTGNFGLVHSGWRGTASNISKRAIDNMKQAGCDVNTIRALIGPAINQCCFEVGPDVSDQFDSVFSIHGVGDRQMLDLKSVLKHQLVETGIKPENIKLENACTCCQDDLYYSYRRNGEKSGRMIAIAGWK